MRPASIDKHLGNLERFFTEDTTGDPAPIEWQFGDGHDFHAMRAVRGLRRYITKLERSQPGEGVTVPEWAVIQSCRYAWTRATYAVDQTARHLRDVWSDLSDGVRATILRDLRDAVDLRTQIEGQDHMDVRTMRELEGHLRHQELTL